MNLDNVTQDQRLLLEKINQYSERHRRTDRLAECMKQFGKYWDNSHTAFVGLSLRALGFATTFKDASQYAQWNITPLGKAALCELKNMSKPATASKIVAESKPSGWRVLGAADGEISKAFLTYSEAEKQADDWARESPNYVYEILAVHTKVKYNLIKEKV